MKLPYREHQFSLDDCQFILVTRRVYPPFRYVVITALALGILIFIGGWIVRYEFWWNTYVAIGVAIGSLGAIPLLFLWKTGQLAVENYLLGNITSVMGHVNWPPIWQNVLAEQAVTFDWAEIEHAVLRPAPWEFAPDNLDLELYFHDGRQRILRVPRLAPHEVEAFVGILELITLRRGVRFQHGDPFDAPLSVP